MTVMQRQRLAAGLCVLCGDKRGPKQRGEGIHGRYCLRHAAAHSARTLAQWHAKKVVGKEPGHGREA